MQLLWLKIYPLLLDRTNNYNNTSRYFLLMNAKAGVSEAAGPPPRASAPESLLFINMSSPSQFSQPSTQKKARSHIMNRYHRLSRDIRVSLPPSTSMDTLLSGLRQRRLLTGSRPLKALDK